MALQCKQCGQALRDSAAFCDKCGTPAAARRSTAPQNSAHVIARCTQTKRPFLMHFVEKASGQWYLVDAQVIEERVAQRGGYDPYQLAGEFYFGDEYKGCPHCSAKSFFSAGCNSKLACWDGVTNPVACPYCNERIPFSGTLTNITPVGDL